MLSVSRILLDPQENIYVNCQTMPPSNLPNDDPDSAAASREAALDSPRTTNTIAKSHHKPKGQHDHGGLDMDEIDRTMFFTPSERQTVSCGAVAIDLRRGRILSLYNKKLGIAQLPKGRKQIGEGHIGAAIRETLEESGVRVRPLPLKVCTRSSAAPLEQQSQHRERQLPAGVDDSNMPTPPASAKAPSVNNEDGAGGSGGGSAPGSVGDRSSMYAESVVTECAAAPRTEQATPANGKASPESRRRHTQCCSPDTDVTSDVFNNEFIGVVRYPDPQSQTPGTLKSIYWFAATFDLEELDRGGGIDANVQEHEKFVVCAYGVRATIDSLRFQAEKDAVRKLVADLSASGIRIGGEGEGSDASDECYYGYESASLAVGGENGWRGEQEQQQCSG
ncbi:hypothetical protein GGTG_11774 [Gaeumannomyces tritici R3-111a-1]|uniref:Nudix hydrolase domain-containing protein n=1 Tax=Gaeumannomyces tritici (strain R3-111a-1) TaxID=644352 RepID=J3PE51_GAET3|nr:hypothetical protein GGTG_11774 [Gaeumannomyces tritici R3-111a-1]EJT70751.1 hypothetical protein GGTG_11774 [Gaeumannomyces tritici R3-111a-1]